MSLPACSPFLFPINLWPFSGEGIDNYGPVSGRGMYGRLFCCLFVCRLFVLCSLSVQLGAFPGQMIALTVAKQGL